MKILVLGTFFNNRNGLPRSQAEDLLEMLRNMGYDVKGVSGKNSSVLRFFDQVWHLIVSARYRQRVVMIDFFGSRTFYLQVILVLLADFLKYKILLNLHGGSLPERYEKSQFLSRVCYGRADVIKTPSSYLKDFIESIGFEGLLLENMIDLERYELPLKSKINPTILWMRTFHEAYDPCTALRAFKLLLNEFGDARLTMAGSDQGLLSACKEMAIDLQIEDRVSFPGFIEHEEKVNLANVCDIYLCTNKIDNAPVSMVEMMALGLVIVSTNAGGIPSLVEHGRTAMLCDPGDAQALCDNLTSVLCHQENSLALIGNAKKETRKYGKEVIKGRWRTLLDALQ
jgi:glycosyltransferase involved in cell wall biosynthesis